MTVPSLRTSIVFAVVAATGSPLEAFLSAFSRMLLKYSYDAVPIRLTELLRDYVAEPNSITWSDEGERIQNLMNAGDLALGSHNHGTSRTF